MPTRYGNDNDSDWNSPDQDVDSTDFTTTWKIYFILFFKKLGTAAEEWELRAKGPSQEAESREPRKTKNKILFMENLGGVYKEGNSQGEIFWVKYTQGEFDDGEFIGKD